MISETVCTTISCERSPFFKASLHKLCSLCFAFEDMTRLADVHWLNWKQYMRDCTSRLRDEKQVQTQSWLNHRKSETESGPTAGACELQSQIEECFLTIVGRNFPRSYHLSCQWNRSWKWNSKTEKASARRNIWTNYVVAFSASGELWDRQL